MTSATTAVPILLYHAVTSSPSALIRPFAVTPETFERHLDCIRELDLHPLTVSQFVDRARDGDRSLPERPVVVTFDDGFRDFLSGALPALRDRDIPATMYVVTGFLEGGRAPRRNGFDDAMLAWSDLPALQAAGIEIGGHTESHPHLDTLSRRAARREMSRCKADLEDALGTAVRSFAYPNGYSSPPLRRMAAELGYTSACAVKNALSAADDDPFALARLTVRAATSIDQLRGWLTASAAPRAPNRERARTRAWRAYRRSRALVSGNPGTDLR